MNALPAASQRWDATGYAANAGFVPALGQDVAALLAPRRGERILDLGCGDGVLTAGLAAVPAERHAATLATATQLLAPALCDSQGNWSADYMRLRFHATAA